MALVKRLATAFMHGALAFIVVFPCVFGGGLAREVYHYPHDGQAGLGPFIIATFAAPVAALVTFVVSYLRQET